MSRTTRLVLALMACALLQAAAGPKQPVERPMVLRSHIENILYLGTWTWDSYETGVCTRGGKFTSEGSGTYDPVTSEFAGEGVLTTASGDQLFWSVVGGPDGEATVGTISFTGGTGRFEGATGEVPVEYTPAVVPSPGPVPALIFTADYVAKGTISY